MLSHGQVVMICIKKRCESHCILWNMCHCWWWFCTDLNSRGQPPLQWYQCEKTASFRPLGSYTGCAAPIDCQTNCLVLGLYLALYSALILAAAPINCQTNCPAEEAEGALIVEAGALAINICSLLPSFVWSHFHFWTVTHVISSSISLVCNSLCSNLEMVR